MMFEAIDYWLFGAIGVLFVITVLVIRKEL